MPDYRKVTILHVDDNKTTLYTIGRILKQSDYNTWEATTGAEALQKAQDQPDLIVLDIQLPDINGFEVCKKLKADPVTKNIPILHLSATYLDDLSKVEGLKSGADGYLTHPVEPLVLIATIKSLLRIREAEKQFRENYINLERNLKCMIDVISETIEMRGPYARGHHQQVKKLSGAIARQLGLTDFQVQGIELAAMVYDIGLISIAANIIQNAERLTGIMLEIYQTYPSIGKDLFRKMEFPWPIADIIYQHRECVDGSGFPGGIKGKDILIEARILAVADAFANLTSNKAYSPPLTTDKALEAISNKSGSAYDHDVCRSLSQLF